MFFSILLVRFSNELTLVFNDPIWFSSLVNFGLKNLLLNFIKIVQRLSSVIYFDLLLAMYVI